jgi:hypothetical protein
MPHAPADPGAFPPDELVAVVNLATSTTEEHDQPATRWSLSDLAAAMINDAHYQAMSRATIWRILDEADRVQYMICKPACLSGRLVGGVSLCVSP